MLSVSDGARAASACFAHHKNLANHVIQGLRPYAHVNDRFHCHSIREKSMNRKPSGGKAKKL